MAARRKREEEAEFLKLNTMSNPTELDILTFALHLLDPSCPAQTTAATLLERHGKLSDVFDTPRRFWRSAPASARALQVRSPLTRTCSVPIWSRKIRRAPVLSIPKPPLPPFRTSFSGRKTEIVVLLILDSKGYLKYMGIVNEGSRARRAYLYPPDCPAVPFCTTPTPFISRTTTQAATARPHGRTSKQPRRSSLHSPV